MSGRDGEAQSASSEPASTGEARSASSEPASSGEPQEENEMTTPSTEKRRGPGPEAPRRVRAADVLGPRGLVQIEHEGEVYTLRLTRNNRLILTK